jgi:RimJ/RimL family protein N-acetyltransferase
MDHYLHFALTLNDKLIGDIQLRHCDRTMPEGSGHIGIDIAQEERGKGAGTAALNLAWEWAVANGFHRLEGSTSEENVAMQKAFQKAGWEFEGRLKKLFMQDSVAIDYLSFAKTI